MDLLIAILIALGLLTSPDAFDDRYETENTSSIERAQTVIDNGWYNYSADGGVIVDEEIDF